MFGQFFFYLLTLRNEDFNHSWLNECFCDLYNIYFFCNWLIKRNPAHTMFWYASLRLVGIGRVKKSIKSSIFLTLMRRKNRSIKRSKRPITTLFQVFGSENRLYVEASDWIQNEIKNRFLIVLLGSRSSTTTLFVCFRSFAKGEKNHLLEYSNHFKTVDIVPKVYTACLFSRVLTNPWLFVETVSSYLTIVR